jgi:hypothetical protein
MHKPLTILQTGVIIEVQLLRNIFLPLCELKKNVYSLILHYVTF